jgi:hypothetical protein
VRTLAVVLGDQLDRQSAALDGVDPGRDAICGDKDISFPKETAEAAARLIPDCTLVLYLGQGHIRATTNKRFGSDVLAYVRGRDASRPTGRHQHREGRDSGREFS